MLRKQSDIRKTIAFPITAVFLISAALVGIVVPYFAGKKFGIRLASDDFDIQVYFSSARWLFQGGRLYREVPSEYPLLANAIFTIVRLLGNLLHPGLYGFYTVWVASACFIYLCTVYRVFNDLPPLATLVWLAPGPVYFALFRFDLYPVVATLIFCSATQQKKYVAGALWLGVAVALKGYALFLLPAYCVFINQQQGFWAAMKIGALAVAPIVLTLAATVVFAGWEGMIAPFKLHATRMLNGESTYDAINYLVGAPVIPNGVGTRRVGQLLQIACAVAPAVMRPRSFEDLLQACLFALLGFMSFSVFYSPQYVLWILPLVCFLGSRVMLITAIFLAWATYLEFPIGYDLQVEIPGLFRTVLVVVCSLRFFMMFWASKGLYCRNI